MSILRTAPKHRASHPQSVTLHLLDDIIPMRTDERSMNRYEALAATGGKLPSNWTDWDYRTRESAERATCGRRPGQRERTDHGTYIQYRQGEVPATERKVPRVKSSRDKVESTSGRITKADVNQYISALGLTWDDLTPGQRKLAKDAMIHAAQIAAYAAA